MRSDKLKLIIDIFLYIILAISVALTVIFYTKIPELDVNPGPVNIYLYWGYILTAFTMFVAFGVGPVLGFIHNPKSIIKALIGLVIFAIIVAISYLLASPEPTPDVLVTASPTAWKWADILLYTMYILGGLGFFAILISEVKNLFE